MPNSLYFKSKDYSVWIVIWVLEKIFWMFLIFHSNSSEVYYYQNGRKADSECILSSTGL